ncbi:MAG TPA: protein kinase [Gemmatimonadaceae bacterium]|nr:protein kinase [Gemmatimonadaceae bacterium]
MPTTEQLNAALDGRYTVERLIGEGGMATVYLARDVKHNRRVALKVLKPDLGAVVGVDRFLSEIEVTANLQHPNLLPLFDSGAADGLLFYVMPYVEGESLRARLDREKQLPIETAVHIATAVASALDYAHRHGVIHRDLKPENILLHEGEPLVADFGIALAVSNAGGNRITQTGLSLGTPQYMSPEQATGDRTIDPRTDVYSLGAVTYEMLVGEAPHTGTTSQAIIARVLTERPRSIRASRPNVAPHIEAAVEHALEKIPADRWASAKEFSEALAGARPVAAPTHATDARTAANVVTTSTRKRGNARELAAWVLAIAGVATGAYFATRKPPVPALAELSANLPESVSVVAGQAPAVAVSRDGRRMVVIGVNGSRRALYVRDLEGGDYRRINGTDSALAPSLSPDAQWVLFHVAGRLKKVATVGGPAQVVADSASGAASWGDGGIIAYERAGQLWTVTTDGANARRVATPDSARRIKRYYLPEVLPGGRFALVTIFRGLMTADSARLAVVSLENGETVDLDMPGSNPHYASGHVLFARIGGVEFAAPFSLKSRKFTGPAVLLLQGVAGGGTLRANLGVSGTGILAYTSGERNIPRALFMVDEHGVERMLRGEPGNYAEPRVSPDGRHIIVRFGVIGNVSRGDLWVSDTATGALSRLTSDGASSRGEWSADGRRVVYLTRAKGSAVQILSAPWDGSGEVTTMSEVSAGKENEPYEISLGPPHGQSALRVRSTGGNTDIWVAPTDSLSAGRPLVATSFFEITPRLSADGTLLAYASNEAGRPEVYVRAVQGDGRREKVSIAGGIEPMWSRTGSTLYYRGPARLMSAVVSNRPVVTVTSRDSLFVDRYDDDGSHAVYDVFPDGHHFLFTRQIRSNLNDASRATVLVNWTRLIGKQTGVTEAR